MSTSDENTGGSGAGNSGEITVFLCGAPRDHECDYKGPTVWGWDDGRTTNDRRIAQRDKSTWGSVTCSICGVSAMERSAWR